MAEPNTKQKSKKKTALIIILAVVAVFIIGIIAIGVIASKIMSNAGLMADVVYPETNDITSDISTSGTISSGNITTYTTGISANVDDIQIREGQIVSKGDTILTFDVSDLEDQYTQASLNARSTELSNQSTIEASNKTSDELATAKRNVSNLNAQIAALKSEIESLSNSVPENTTLEELEAALAEKRSQLATTLDEIQEIIDTNPSDSDLNQNADYLTKCAERDVLNSTISNLEAIIESTPNESISISSVIEAKNMELAQLQSELASQEAIVSSAEAGVLTTTQREQLNVASQLSNMQVESAATMLEEGKAGIVAEQDGIITSVNVTKGSPTTPGYQLFSIADMNDLRIHVPLSKSELETVELGQTATITILNKEYEGKVTYISHMAEANANGGISIEAEVTIQNPDDNIVLGLDAKVVIHTASVEGVMTVPNLAINVDTTGTFVFTVEDNLLVKKYVTTGISDINNCEIIDGIDENTMVITNVTAEMEEGMPVVPNLTTDETQQ